MRCLNLKSLTGGHFLIYFALILGNILLAVPLLLTGSQALAGEERLAPIQVMPSETTVLLLPALDATKDSPNMQAPRQLVIHHRAQYEFITRQFKILGEGMAAKTADVAPRIELAKSSTRTAQNIGMMAERTHADWVVNIVVEEVKGNSSTPDGFKADTRLLLQVWDARRHGWMVNHTYTGQASGGGSPVFVFKNSLDAATKISLENILGAYPQVVPVLLENGLNDYLEGQTEAFVGDPKKPFSGLKVAQ